MVAGGPWVGAQYERENPDFDFGVMPMPVPTDDPYPIPFAGAGGDDAMWIYADTQVPAVVGDVLRQVMSDEGATAWGKIVGFGSPPFIPEARQAAAESYSPEGQASLRISEENMVAAPEALLRNTEGVNAVNLAYVAPSPGFGEVLQAIFVGEVSDIDGALQDVKDRSEAALDAAIAEVQQQGIEVSREDYVFADWNQRDDFPVESYR